jgi:enoyl-[acyl-carrier protein] reductase/trans-2-enoyl-CoA reductase (NAD+)
MIRNNICMNAHPIGCRKVVADQVAYVRSRESISGPSNVLVIGASQGYGLSSRIVAAFGAGARTIGVSFENPAKSSRTASAGWYMDHAFADLATQTGVEHESMFADAFAHETKDRVIERARSMMGPIDLVVYSLASPVRTDPDDGTLYRSSIKTIGDPYEARTIDAKSGTLSRSTIEPASEDEIAHTVKVMGGEDWALWIDSLSSAGVLSPTFTTVAYSYIGPVVTFPIYRDGTIGRAKEHLERTARELGERYPSSRSLVSVNKALVTRASAVIPGVSLYLAILYRVMKEKGVHEGTIEQMYRLFAERLYGGSLDLDSEGRVRVDDLEMREDVQAATIEAWNSVTEETLDSLADVDGFRSSFLNIHGFGYPDIDYESDVEV